MKIIGIIGAMPSELVDLRQELGKAEVVEHCGFTFHINIIDGKKIINACCGTTKVNAALCTQVMVDKFNITGVINAGIAGGMGDDVRVCDFVISSEVVPHDVDPHFLNKYPPYCSVYKSDKLLINLAEKACNELEYKNHIGRIASGEAFISDNEVKLSIKNGFDPLAVDMESSAIGHAAFTNKIASVSIRCISDNADDDGAMSFEKFEKIAARRVADVLLKVIELA